MPGLVVLDALYSTICMVCATVAVLRADLRHARATDGSAVPSEFPECKHQGGSECGEQEPHEDEAGLDLAASLLGVVGAKGNPVGRFRTLRAHNKR